MGFLLHMSTTQDSYPTSSTQTWAPFHKLFWDLQERKVLYSKGNKLQKANLCIWKEMHFETRGVIGKDQMWTKIKNLKINLKVNPGAKEQRNMMFMLLFKDLKQSFLLAGFTISLWILEGLISALPPYSKSSQHANTPSPHSPSSLTWFYSPSIPISCVTF